MPPPAAPAAPKGKSSVGFAALAQRLDALMPGAQETYIPLPKKGVVAAYAIAADAPHPRNAHLFIDYILRPEVHASLTNKVFYANPNKASLKFVKKDVAENKTVFLGPEEMARMTVPDTVPQDTRRVQTRVFQSFKANR